uniref:Uncharacterized protein n=1 Tax=Ceratitis capitata TaxID=7213 RepID=W8AGQ1_CERCA
MTTQEAKIKNDIQRKEEYNKYSELYFPELRSTVCSIFSGDILLIEKLTKSTCSKLTELRTAYDEVKRQEDIQSDVPIQVEFTDEGLSIAIVIREQQNNDQQYTIRIIQFIVLDWTKDVEVLTILAKALNETVLQCTRIIPKLINNRANFRNINMIETNPIYEYMVLVYSMYKMLHIEESLPGCYVQTLMARKRITYNMLCHTLKYSTKLPEPVKNWFKDENIVRKLAYIPRYETPKTTDDQNQTENHAEPDVDEQQNNQWALHLIDYTGQKFIQRLSFQYAPKRVYTNDRYVDIDGDVNITG